MDKLEILKNIKKEQNFLDENSVNFIDFINWIYDLNLDDELVLKLRSIYLSKMDMN